MRSPSNECASCGLEETCEVHRHYFQEDKDLLSTAHQALCSELANAEQQYLVEDEKLRSDPVNHFESSSGKFWDVEDTRAYLLARMAVVNCLKKIDTQASLELAMNHCLELLPLCRNDRVGLRNEIPTLMLSLGQDQECYDFIKWWTTNLVDFCHNWVHGKEAPWVLQHADAYEDLTAVFTGLGNDDASQVDIHHAVNMTLLKIKLLIDVQARQIQIQASESGNTTDFMSAISANRINSLDVADLDQLSLQLPSQIRMLYKTVNYGNEFFWDTLLNATSATVTEPLKYPIRVSSASEAVLMVRLYKEAWDDVPGAMGVLRLQTGA